MLSLALAFFFFVVAVFDKDYLIKFYNAFTKELIGAALVGVALYKLLMLFQAQWLFFSRGASNALFKVLSLFYPAIMTFEGNTPIVGTNAFAIAIGSPCSGIDSMFLFTAFCAGLFALDHKRLKKGVFALSFVIGFVGVYAVNILRLFLLVLAGIYISPEFSVGLFHTNAGWVLFIIYFLLYYWIIKKFIYKNKVPAQKGKPVIKK
jgi:exosortase/archaeosortase family protein